MALLKQAIDDRLKVCVDMCSEKTKREDSACGFDLGAAKILWSSVVSSNTNNKAVIKRRSFSVRLVEGRLRGEWDARSVPRTIISSCQDTWHICSTAGRGMDFSQTAFWSSSSAGFSSRSFFSPGPGWLLNASQASRNLLQRCHKSAWRHGREAKRKRRNRKMYNRRER